MDNTNKSDEGWKSVLADVTGAKETFGFWTAFGQMIRSPRSTAIRLAEETRFDSHQRYAAVCLSAWLAFTVLVLPWVVEWYTGETLPTADTKYVSLALSLMNYATLAISVVLGFFVYRFGTTIPRSPKSYFKFALLTAGITMLLSIFLTALRFAAIFAIRGITDEPTGLAIINNPWLIASAELTLFALPLILTMVMNKAFWGLSWRYAVPAALGLAAINVAVLVAAIQFFGNADVADAISKAA